MLVRVVQLGQYCSNAVALLVLGCKLMTFESGLPSTQLGHGVTIARLVAVQLRIAFRDHPYLSPYVLPPLSRPLLIH